MSKNLIRCNWVGSAPSMIKYHDTEWGVPNYDDKKLFEFIILDTFQAGLSWAIVLNKRSGFRQAFAGFDVEKVAQFTHLDIEQQMLNSAIVRNRLKLKATVNNAQKVLEVQKEFGSLSNYLWQFVGGKPKVNAFKNYADIPATSQESDAMSKDMKARGFKFVGSTVCYAFCQGAGMVNDHVVDCFRYKKLL